MKARSTYIELLFSKLFRIFLPLFGLLSASCASGQSNDEYIFNSITTNKLIDDICPEVFGVHCGDTKKEAVAKLCSDSSRYSRINSQWSNIFLDSAKLLDSSVFDIQFETYRDTVRRVTILHNFEKHTPALERLRPYLGLKAFIESKLGPPSFDTMIVTTADTAVENMSINSRSTNHAVWENPSREFAELECDPRLLSFCIRRHPMNAVPKRW